MGKNYFTTEQIELLATNPYVLKVEKKHISFTNEFRELCLIEYDKGLLTKDIFDKYEIGYHVIGASRASACIRRFRAQSLRMEGFNRVEGSGRPKLPVFINIEDENRYLKEQVEYYKQEAEFLKKLDALERTAISKYHRSKNIK